VAEYAITFARSARKELEKLPAAIAERIFNRIEALALEPRPTGCMKLRGQKDIWRIRVGDYRVVYVINDAKHTIDISVIRHRKDVYRDF
jgi:mRNA interferase RelE/StbE